MGEIKIEQIKGKGDFDTAGLKLGVFIHRLAAEHGLTELQLVSLLNSEMQTSLRHLMGAQNVPELQHSRYAVIITTVLETDKEEVMISAARKQTDVGSSVRRYINRGQFQIEKTIDEEMVITSYITVSDRGE